MKKNLFVLFLMFCATVTFAQTVKESSYKKASRRFDEFVQNAKPKANALLKSVVEDTQQSLIDFAEDINAPKEQQSSFAKAFNFIA